jgi:phosphatidylglycerophosphatase A
MKDFYGLLSKIIATVFFIGYIPFAPGTFGSLAGLLFIWLLKPGAIFQIIIIISVFVAGVLSARIAEQEFGEKDSSRIVIDEFAGYLIAVAFLPLSAGYLIAAFFLFRLFDLVKPSPIRNIEKIFSGGIGVMIDDLAAGVVTNIILQVIKLLSN